MSRKLMFAAAAVALAACGTARLVSRDQFGGVIALDGDRQKAMEEAQRMMADNCRGPYSIVSEGEKVVGSETSHTDESYVTKDGRVVNQGGETTRQATEWRVQYQCGGQPPPGAAPPQAPAYPDPATSPPPPPPPR
jgi:hypothetical protein